MAAYFSETLHEGFRQTLEIEEMLIDERTDLQSVKIFDSKLNGRVMVLDEIVQITTRDEASYSEMLTHFPIYERLAQGLETKRILIVGGGDGAIAEEALKHEMVEKVEMAEIDARVVELCKTYFADVSGNVWDHPRFDLHLIDAFEHLKRPDAAGAYDVIIADRPDPVGPAEVLFADAFYEAVARALSPSGFAVFQNGAPFYQPDELTDTMAQLGRTFDQCGLYVTVTPTYTGGFMALTWASREAAVTAGPDAIDRAVANRPVPTDYYSPAIHMAAQAAPEWIRRLVPEAQRAAPTAAPEA
jgi:spermidine synthase